MLEGFGRIRGKYRWIFVDKKVNNRVMVKIQAEVVNGKCPTCDEYTMLVGLTNELYRCMNCGSDLQQHVNGKITYLPILTTPADGATPFVKEWKDG
jgi:tRNA(Ile2) C34 agmatinyltransferase TiaS